VLKDARASKLLIDPSAQTARLCDAFVQPRQGRFLAGDGCGRLLFERG